MAAPIDLTDLAAALARAQQAEAALAECQQMNRARFDENKELFSWHEAKDAELEAVRGQLDAARMRAERAEAALATMKDELASMTVRMQIAEDGRQIETRRAERALDTLGSYEQQQWMARAIGAEAAEERMLAEHIRRTTTEGDGQTNRGIFMVMGPEPTEGFPAEHNEARRGDSPKSVIRSAPGLPADYMMVRKDYLTELHRTRAQAMAEYRRLCEKYASAMRELHYFQQERQQGVVRLRRIEGTLPADDLRRAFADGAAWWNFNSTGFTMFGTERRDAEAEAEARFPNGKPGPVEVQP